MKKILLIVLCAAIFGLTSCAPLPETTYVNGENQETASSTLLGKGVLVRIGNRLYYDLDTRIVYWWNGVLSENRQDSTIPFPYYAPNGLPYLYDPETNTFEEIVR